jgi:hypothetical protein
MITKNCEKTRKDKDWGISICMFMYWPVRTIELNDFTKKMMDKYPSRNWTWTFVCDSCSELYNY